MSARAARGTRQARCNILKSCFAFIFNYFLLVNSEVNWIIIRALSFSTPRTAILTLRKDKYLKERQLYKITSRSHPAWAALSRPIFGFCCHVFCFLEGEAHFAGFSTPPVLPCKGTKIMRTGQIFAQLFSGILHQNSASRIFTIDSALTRMPSQGCTQSSPASLRPASTLPPTVGPSSRPLTASSCAAPRWQTADGLTS